MFPVCTALKLVGSPTPLTEKDEVAPDTLAEMVVPAFAELPTPTVILALFVTSELAPLVELWVMLPRPPEGIMKSFASPENDTEAAEPVAPTEMVSPSPRAVAPTSKVPVLLTVFEFVAVWVIAVCAWAAPKPRTAAEMQMPDA